MFRQWSSAVHGQLSLWLVDFGFGFRLGFGFALGMGSDPRWNLESSHQYAASARPDTSQAQRLRYMAIENAFAAAIGDHAVEELERVRKAPTSAFDSSGKKPMAPEGFHYFPISLRPYEEELKPNLGWEQEALLKANAPPKNVVGELEREIKESVVEVELERDIKESVDGEYGSPPRSRSWNAL